MSEMVERVALATCESVGCICKNRLGFEGMPCLDRARRGIAAMREPTDAMRKAVERGTTITGAWQAMIDEALR